MCVVWCSRAFAPPPPLPLVLCVAPCSTAFGCAVCVVRCCSRFPCLGRAVWCVVMCCVVSCGAVRCPSVPCCLVRHCAVLRCAVRVVWRPPPPAPCMLSLLLFLVPCTLCELPLRERLNERANMCTQNNFFVRKRPFSMCWNGGYGFKNNKKTNYRSLREETTPFPYTAWPWSPFNALFVLCRSPVSAATLANANLRQIRASFARIWREFVRDSRTGMHILIHNNTHVHFAGHELSKRTMLVVCAACGV